MISPITSGNWWFLQLPAAVNDYSSYQQQHHQLSVNFLVCPLLSFYPCTLVTITELGAMSNKENPDSILAAALPKILKLSLNSSRPYRLSVSLFHSGPGKSTHSFIDQYLHAELHEKVFVDVDNFFTKFVLPISAVCIEFLNKLIKTVCNRFRSSKDWEMPNTYLNSVFEPWL